MDNQQLRDLINDFKKQGQSDESIVHLLTVAGYKEEDIRSALASENNAAVSVAPENDPATPAGQAPQADPAVAPNGQAPTTEKLTGFSQLFSDTVSLFKRKIGVLLGIYIIPMLGTLLLLFIPRSSGGDIAIMIVSLLDIILSIAGGTALIYAVSSDSGVIESYGKAFGIFWKYLWVSVLATFVILGGFVMGVVPGIIFSGWFILGFYVLVLEDKRGVNALLRSKEYITGYWWNVFFKFLLFVLVIFGAGIIVGLFKLINADFELILAFIFELVITPLFFTFTFLIYKGLAGIKPQLMSAPVSGNKRFFEFSGWLGLFAPALIAVAVVIVLNPSQLIQQAQDSQRVQDASTLNMAVTDWLADVSTSAWKAGLYCSGGNGSFPGGGTCLVSGSTSTDGTGWAPINFDAMTTGSPMPSLPMDPENNLNKCLSSGGTCFYAIRLDPTFGQYRIYVPLETREYQNNQGAKDGVNLPGWYVVGSDIPSPGTTQ
ncbi:MAG: sulfite exporter TauE/SafE family protein [Patescibacteria group bacterium]|nr:sulfite exporter TauE/SafE family protein [Patescibacteria group bacterium]